MIKVILFVLVNIILAGLYLWAVEYNRHICLILWFAWPLTDALMLPMLEKKY